MPKQKQLTPQQVRFCHEYHVSGNAGSAAIQAGFRMKYALNRGNRLLKMPIIKAYLEELQAEERQKYKATAEKVMYELGLIAFADAGDYVTWGNDFCELKLIPENKRRQVSEITITSNRKGKKVRLKLHDKIAALRLLGQHFGMFEKPMQITASQTQSISIHTHQTTGVLSPKVAALNDVTEGTEFFLREAQLENPSNSAENLPQNSLNYAEKK